MNNLNFTTRILSVSLSILLVSFSQLMAQTSNVPSGKTSQIAIEVLDDQFMKGRAIVSNARAKKMEVVFTPQLVTVKIPDGEKSILLQIDNTDCKAYCPKQKRIRQLHAGDEKLLMNLIKARKDSIKQQLGG